MKLVYFYFFILSSFKLTYSSYLVYRVNWLQAKGRVDRWREELILLKNEMQWTKLWFQNQSNLWRERSKMADGVLPIGHQAYAIKQQKIWDAFVKKSSNRFEIYMY